jgi:hypothetical protein
MSTLLLLLPLAAVALIVGLVIRRTGSLRESRPEDGAASFHGGDYGPGDGGSGWEHGSAGDGGFGGDGGGGGGDGGG